MKKKRTRSRKKSNNVIGGQWLANLLVWVGVILMLTGGIIAYPTLQASLIPPDTEGLEFSVTLTPVVEAAAPLAQSSSEELLQVTLQPSATPLPELETALSAPTESQAVVEQASVLAPTSIPTWTPMPSATPAATPTPTINPADLLPTRLVIPAIDLDAPILEVGWESKEVNGDLVSNWIVPNEFAAGWHVTSARPGEPGNTVLNGHHNIYGEVFRYLVDLEPGDEIIMYTNHGPRYYAVTELQILEEKYASADIRMDNAKYIHPTEDERVTLVTCWPYTNNTHRLIVVALPFEPMPTPTSRVK